MIRAMSYKAWHNVSWSMDDGFRVKDWLLVSLEALFSSGDR